MKLFNKNLEKTKIAYHLAKTIEGDLRKSQPTITIDENDEYIGYLIDAIKHACGI